MKRRRLFVVLVVILGTVLAARTFHETGGGIGSARGDGTVRVADGDTVVMVIDGRAEKVRLLNIDAPELAQRPWGERSRKHLEDIIKTAGGKLRLEYGERRLDKYGRILAWLWAEDGKLVNLEMVRDGYAFALIIPPNIKYADAFRKAEQEALEKGIGILGDIKVRPGEYKRKHPRR